MAGAADDVEMERFNGDRGEVDNEEADADRDNPEVTRFDARSIASKTSRPCKPSSFTLVTNSLLLIFPDIEEVAAVVDERADPFEGL